MDRPARENVFVEPFSKTMSRHLAVKREIFSKETAYQKVDVVETYDYGVTLFLDSFFQTSERDEFFYHESLVHPAMMTHPNPERILIIGGGDGGTLEEAAKHSCVRKIVMVELDGEVVDIARRHLGSICGKAFDDPRLELVIGDGRRFVEDTDNRFDVIILDLTDPLEPSKYVYTKEFYTLCKRRLNPGGVLALHNDSPFYYPKAFNVISKTLGDVFPYKAQYLSYIVGYMLDFAFSVCSPEPLPDPHEEELERRLLQRGVTGLQFYSPQMHGRLFALPGYVLRILEQPCAVSTDASPYVLEQ